MMDRWMQGVAETMHRGAFSKKAKAAGMGTEAFADKVLGPNSKATTKTKRQANLAERFAEAKHPKKARLQHVGRALKGK